MIDIKQMEKKILEDESNIEQEGEHSIAYMLLKDSRLNARRWFIIAIAELIVILSIVAGMIWYNSLPVESYEATIETDGDANSIAGIGDNYGNSGESISQDKTR